MIGASGTPFRIKPPRLIADSTTETAANNATASGWQQGYARGAMNAGAGRSHSKMDDYQAELKQAESVAGGAQEAASIRADDQQFNESQRNANQMLQEQARIFDKNQATELNSANFSRRFAAKQGTANVAMARQRAAMNLRLALISAFS